MKDKRSREILLLVIIALLALAVPLQYLIRKEVVVGLPSEHAHSEAHGDEGHEGDQQGEETNPGSRIVTNYGFEVGTREQISGWSTIGGDTGAVIYRDDDVSRHGFASAAVNTNGAFVADSGWFTKLDEVPRSRDLVFSGYVKTEGLRGEAYLRLLCEGAVEGQDTPHLIASVSTDDLHGTNDWTLASVRCFVPPEATGIWLEVGMFGSGQAWFDDLSLEVKEREDILPIGQELLKNPSLQDGAKYWHILSSIHNPLLDYGDAGTGPLGQPSFLFKRMAGAQGGACGLYQSMTGFYGHVGTLTVSGWMRSDGLDGSAFLAIRIFKASGELGLRSTTVISGTSPWTEVRMNVPLDGSVDDIWVAVNMDGSGSINISGLSATFQEEPAGQ